MARLVPNIMADPSPCMDRAAISSAKSLDTAPTPEPIANTRQPTRKSVPWPNASPRRPAISTPPTSNTKYAFMTQPARVTSMSRSLVMVGRIDDTGFIAQLASKYPNATINNTRFADGITTTTLEMLVGSTLFIRFAQVDTRLEHRAQVLEVASPGARGAQVQGVPVGTGAEAVVLELERRLA